MLIYPIFGYLTESTRNQLHLLKISCGSELRYVKYMMEHDVVTIHRARRNELGI